MYLIAVTRLPHLSVHFHFYSLWTVEYKHQQSNELVQGRSRALRIRSTARRHLTILSASHRCLALWPTHIRIQRLIFNSIARSQLSHTLTHIHNQRHTCIAHMYKLCTDYAMLCTNDRRRDVKDLQVHSHLHRHHCRHDDALHIHTWYFLFSKISFVCECICVLLLLSSSQRTHTGQGLAPKWRQNVALRRYSVASLRVRQWSHNKLFG